MTIKRHYYVYELVDPRNGETFYVGKGSGDRLNNHVRDHLRGCRINPGKQRRIGEIILSGYDVVSKAIACFKIEGHAYQFERELIVDGGESLTNIADGGSVNSVRSLVTEFNYQDYVFDGWLIADLVEAWKEFWIDTRGESPADYMVESFIFFINGARNLSKREGVAHAY